MTMIGLGMRVQIGMKPTVWNETQGFCRNGETC